MIGGSYSDFDVPRLWDALNAKRMSKGLTERGMMDELNLVNNQRVPMSLSTVKNMVKRDDTTCQHALHMLRWLDKTPESFLVGAQIAEPLPFSAEGRLYWSMRELSRAVSSKKDRQGLAWKQVAQALRCSSSQVSGLHKLRYGTSVHLAMRITQWLERPSSDFIVVV